MLDELLLNPKTKNQAKLFVQNPFGSLLIIGENGSGKLVLAKTIAAEILQLDKIEKLQNYPYFSHVLKKEGLSEISIDEIRNIIRFLHLKTVGKIKIRRVVLIENANQMSIEAQNALLKILEEPNDDSVFILTAPNSQSLLPTIVSRCRHIHAYPLALDEAMRFLKNRYTAKQIESAWRLSGGNSSLLQALLDEGSLHPLKQAVDQAKNFIKLSSYNRLILTYKLGNNRDELKLFLEALSKVLNVLHRGALDKNKTSLASLILNDRRLVKSATKAIDSNANAKLVALYLGLNFKL